ncbi:Cellulose synthase-like protein E1 [Vitis vinifera]|uniref:Cellulose synthase-like protein E1 n=1 Tax=Vitis vinifera TaxID=29760 RepID=A0A438HRW0_VITVI|nr:Cellulose synthase-like protein E1 [Vitis vinifera]
MGIKGFLSSFNSHIVPTCSGLQTACLHYTMSLSHPSVSLEASPCFQSLWALPFAYVIIANYAYSLGEILWFGGTIQGWWNEQRIWALRRTTSYFFALLDTILKLLGFAETTFAVTAKVSDEDVSRRYEQEVMEFGSPSPMFTIIATLAMLNLFSFVCCVKRLFVGIQIKALESLALQGILCGVVVLINLPVYQGLFFRKDKGAMPTSVTYKSVALALLACSIALYQ